MRPAPGPAVPLPAAGPLEPAQVITRRLAAAGLAVHSTQRQERGDVNTGAGWPVSQTTQTR